MRLQKTRRWMLGFTAAFAVLSADPCRQLCPMTSAKAAWASEAPAWELRPYRLCVLLCADESPRWTETGLAELAGAMTRRGTAEYGHLWHVTVEVAAETLRTTVLGGDELATRNCLSVINGQDGADKRIVVVLRAESGELTVEVSEYDVASHGWHRVPRRMISVGPAMHAAVFESLSEAVTPLAAVKSSAGERVVLRLRGGLLPVRNPRRLPAEVGSIFRLAARDAMADNDHAMGGAYLVVEKVNGYLLECRSVGVLPILTDAAMAERWVAVGVRPLHAATLFTFNLVGPPPESPVAGCDIWLGEERDTRGMFLGRTDDRGQVTVRAANRVHWLHVRLGAVALGQFPVVPGACAEQRVSTQLNTGMLAVAVALNDSAHHVLTVTALCSTYLARAKSRERAGRVAEADALRTEGRRVIEERVAAVRRQIRDRRQRVAGLFPVETGYAESQWTALDQQMEEALQSMSAEAVAGRNHE